MDVGGMVLEGGQAAAAERLMACGEEDMERAMDAVERRYGPYAAYLLREVVFYSHKCKDDFQRNTVRDALRFLASRDIRNAVRSVVTPDSRWLDGFSHH